MTPKEVARDSQYQRNLEFDNLWDVVHLDEKMLNADKDHQKVYLVPGEAPPWRAWKSKRFIPKVMFLAAVARPRFDTDRGVVFNGKIGMWTFSRLLPAARNSRNRPAGTILTRLVNVDTAVYCKYVLNKVVAAIKVSFPSVNKVTFQAVMSLILEHSGGNGYVLPPLKEAALRRSGLLMSNDS
ncbi:hypothetical protein H257_06814 [Aphanomyces astaci]|uniref:Uncharacterized protein n=1 Tax=Aphanomyces astaci TaxID=112090 RepID=W4GKL3_APHAT|nr:hypothetical protein H257_06814 [Aphanomyces astaci]ETV79549.1 hypothetical protein H257_06814 [Aphanomyces astaci]|eukprot:XP_009830485.1 hypothetical protein H257_06814 [Aphanomyces astaci]